MRTPSKSYAAVSALALIVFLAGWVRFVALGEIPPGFNQDEASNGYDAYCFLHTGRDRHGDRLPITLKAFSDLVDHRSPVYAYCSILPVAIFGLGHFAARFTAAALGTLSVPLCFIAGRALFGRFVGLLAAAFLAVSPWHIFMSRFGHEPCIVPFFMLLAVVLTLKGMLGRPAWLYAAGMAWAAAVYNYPVTRLFVPLFLCALGVAYRDVLRRRARHAVGASVLAGVLVLPLAHVTWSNYAKVQGRFRQISILDEPPTRAVIIFVGNYVNHLLPQFLCLRGGRVEGHDIKISYVFLFPFLLWGIVRCMRRRQPGDVAVLAWFLLSPIPASLTRFYPPNALRAIVMIPSIELLAAVGVVDVVARLRRVPRLRRVVVGALVSIGLASTMLYLISYFVVYPNYPAPGFQYGFREALAAAWEMAQPGDRIVVTNCDTNQPYIFVLFYGRYPPSKFQRERVVREYRDDGWGIVRAFGRYRFGRIRRLYDPSVSSVYVARPEEAEEVGVVPERVIYYPRSSRPAFVVFRSGKGAASARDEK